MFSLLTPHLTFSVRTRPRERAVEERGSEIFSRKGGEVEGGARKKKCQACGKAVPWLPTGQLFGALPLPGRSLLVVQIVFLSPFPLLDFWPAARSHGYLQGLVPLACSRQAFNLVLAGEAEIGTKTRQLPVEAAAEKKSSWVQPLLISLLL